MNLKMTEDLYILELPGDKLEETEKRRILEQAGEMSEEVQTLLEEAESVACPRTLFGAMLIQEKGEDYVIINNVTFRSAFLREKMEKAGRVFPYISTCGTELEVWSQKYVDDILIGFWTDAIKKAYLAHAKASFYRYLQENLGLGEKFTRMSPGSLAAWPIAAQKDLFAALGEDRIRELAGVSLTNSLLMLPSKSVSGITFPSEASFENCELCPIPNCPNRKAPSKIR